MNNLDITIFNFEQLWAHCASVKTLVIDLELCFIHLLASYPFNIERNQQTYEFPDETGCLIISTL